LVKLFLNKTSAKNSKLNSVNNSSKQNDSQQVEVMRQELLNELDKLVDAKLKAFLEQSKQIDKAVQCEENLSCSKEKIETLGTSHTFLQQDQSQSQSIEQQSDENRSMNGFDNLIHSNQMEINTPIINIKQWNSANNESTSLLSVLAAVSLTAAASSVLNESKDK